MLSARTFFSLKIISKLLELLQRVRVFFSVFGIIKNWYSDKNEYFECLEEQDGRGRVEDEKIVKLNYEFLCCCCCC